ncbi:MAG: efflux RND transporter periplasmic adaptor subunit, partial [Bacteroidota bacterium]
PKSIKRGQTLSIKLALSDKTQALLLERGSFYQETGGNWVYLIDPNTGNAYKRDIKVGRQNPSYYEVLQGLEVGDLVITSSYDNYNQKDELILK